MSTHFLLKRRTWFRDGRTWIIFRAVRDPRHNSDHYLVLGCLCGAPLREHTEYLGRRKRLPLRPPPTSTRDGGLFAALRRAILKLESREAQKIALILVAT